MISSIWLMLKIKPNHPSEKIQENLISTEYVKAREKTRDIFTKALRKTRVDYFFNKLDMINIYIPT